MELSCVKRQLKLEKEYYKLQDKFRDDRGDLAEKYAKYKIGQKIRYNNFPDSVWQTGVIDDVSIDILGNDVHIVYYVRDWSRIVYESETYGCVASRKVA